MLCGVMVSLAAPCIGLSGKVPQWGCVSVFVALGAVKAGSLGGRKEGNWPPRAKKRQKMVESETSETKRTHRTHRLFPPFPRTALQGVARDPQRPTHRCRTPRRIAGDGTGDSRAHFTPLGRLTHQTCVEPPRASTAKAAAWAVKGAWGQRRSSSWAHVRVAHDRREAVHNTRVAAQGCTCLRSIEGGHGWSCLVSPPARAQNGSSRGLETDAKSYEVQGSGRGGRGYRQG